MEPTVQNNSSEESTPNGITYENGQPKSLEIPGKVPVISASDTEPDSNAIASLSIDDNPCDENGEHKELSGSDSTVVIDR